MLYVRGNKYDYDEWAAMGNTGWSYSDVLPYFIKSEDQKNSQKTTVQRVSILSSKCLDSCVPPLPPETACPENAQDNESPALASQILSSLWNIEFQGHLIN